MVTSPQVGCLGVSFHAAHVAVRERLVFPPAAIERTLHEGQRAGRFEGFVILSTCNRVEFYAHLPGRDVCGAIVDLLQKADVDLDAVWPYFYRYESIDAARHLCRVAAGLDSMVLGEPQILGQVGAAFRQAEAHGLASSELATMFQTAMRVGKRARTETALNRNPVSVASVAVNLAQRVAGPMDALRVTVIGAGEMGMLVAKILQSHNVGQLTILNRNEAVATAFADRVGCQPRPLSELPHQLAETDLVISTTKANRLLIEEQHVQGRSLVLIDLAVPRDIDPSVAGLPGIRLFDMDDLRAGVDASLNERRREIPMVEQIIEEELDKLQLRLRTMTVEPVIAGLRQKAEAIRQQELDRALGAMGALSPTAEQQLRHFSRTLVNKLLHDPTLRLRQGATGDNSEQYAALVRSLFALQEGASA